MDEYKHCHCGNRFKISERQNSCTECQGKALRTAAKVAVSLNTKLDDFCEEMATTTEDAEDVKNILIELGIDKIWESESEVLKW